MSEKETIHWKARAVAAEAKYAAAEKNALYWRDIATQSSGEACTEHVRRIESEAKYKRLVERLREELADTDEYYDCPFDGKDHLCVRVERIEAAIKESEGEG